MESTHSRNSRPPCPVLFVCLMMLGVVSALAQSGSESVQAVNIVAGAHAAGTATASPLPMQHGAAATDADLVLVVALFRHSIRAPLQDFGSSAKDHSGDQWPDLVNDWRVDWGDLTPRGTQVAKALGNYYRDHYWRGRFKAYLWADAGDQRTRLTAEALAAGLKGPGMDVQVAFLAPCAVDPLFHPFKAQCGKPSQGELTRIVGDIKKKWREWLENLNKPGVAAFSQLYSVLACNTVQECKQPLAQVSDTATAWSGGERGSSPVQWKGQFPYASSASEAFLLEYSNGMAPHQVGWGRIPIPAPEGGPWNLRTMLQIHEFYFDKTDRDPYLAKIGGSNLIREIADQIKRKAGQKPYGECPRAEPESQFVGLVGHDTSLASVGKLLDLAWSFDNRFLVPSDDKLPPDTAGLPDNDALPGGALIFELWKTGTEYEVNIEYVFQSLLQMRDGSPRPPSNPFRLKLACGDPSKQHPDYPCVLSLAEFNKRVANAIGTNNEFLSRCKKGEKDKEEKQVCP